MASRRCRTCRDTKPPDAFSTFSDGGVTYVESVCKECAVPFPAKPKAAKARRELAPAVALPPETFKLTRAQRAECKELLKEYPTLDVDNPVHLISSACVYTGVRPAMCLDMSDRRNPVPCMREVRAAKGALNARAFVELCRSVASGARVTPSTARRALALAARYDAAGGRDFAAMCAAVSIANSDYIATQLG